MINRIKQAIVNQIINLYPRITIYDEDVPQDFDTPSFFISVVDQDYNKRISNRYSSTLSFDISYFSDQPNTDIKNDCLLVQQNLFRHFDLLHIFRVKEKNANITDNVLHFMFKIKYSEIEINTEEVKVKSLTSNVDVKE